MELPLLIFAAALQLGGARPASGVVPPPRACGVHGPLENSSSWAEHDLRHMRVPNCSACALECCKIPECGGFTFAASVNWQSTECPLGSSCCFLKDLATGRAHLVPVANATSGLVHGGRRPGPLPPPPPAPRPPSPPSPASCSALHQPLPCEQANLRSRLRCWWNESHCLPYPVGPKGGGSCHSSTDCFGGGDCMSGRCHCDPTWTGPHCKHLHLLPMGATALVAETLGRAESGSGRCVEDGMQVGRGGRGWW